MLWPPLSKCCGSAPVSSCCSLFTSVQGQHRGGTRGPHPPSPSPPFIVIDKAEVYCYVCSHLKWFFCAICSMSYCTSKLAVSYPKLSAQEKKLIPSISWKGEKKGVKGELALALFFSWFLFPKIKIPRKQQFPKAADFKINMSKE